MCNPYCFQLVDIATNWNILHLNPLGQVLFYLQGNAREGTVQKGDIMNKEKISTTKAPVAIGPYSQAVKANGCVFTSGQIALDPKTNRLVEGGISEQTHQVIRNLSEVLQAAGSSLDQVVKATVFIKDMDDFATINGIYSTYFTSAVLPARSVVQVVRLPKDVLIEMEVVAVL